MTIQFKSITQLRAMLDEKLISPLELTQESLLVLCLRLPTAELVFFWALMKEI